MDSHARRAVVALATVTVAIAACQSTSAPSPASPAASSPSLVPTVAPLTSGSLAPGRYALDDGRSAPSIEVPAGWIGSTDHVASVGRNIDSSVGDELNWGLWPTGSDPVDGIFGDACRAEGTLVTVDGTVQGLIDALDAQAATDATVTDVVLGGMPGQRIDLVQSAGLDRATCEEGAEGPIKIWPGYYALAPDHRGIVDALEVDGRLVIFTGTIGPSATTEAVAELESIIASLEFGS